jgi:steroid 5-alpha reductase family enzyme
VHGRSVEVSQFDSGAFAAGVGWAGAAMVAVLAVTYAASRIAGRHSVIDTAWGLLFVAAAVSGYVTSAGHGNGLRRLLLVVLPLIWGLRLATHIGRRSRGKPEDPRYAKLLAKAKGNPEWYALRSVYLLQGVLALVISAPLLVGPFETGPVGVLAWLGVVLWATGVFFEAVGDRQLERFRTDPGNRGRVMDSGLWRYTRHPNYFGDACVWWGMFLVAAERWPGVLTGYAPALMTLLLTKGSGARILEQHMSGRPGWSQYAARTSAFFPWPPRRSPAGH